MMRLGPRGEALIKDFEKLRLSAYNDGFGNYTIGWGHTHGVYRGMAITKEMAEKFFREDVEIIENDIDKLQLDLTQAQFDALLSLCFNVRQGAGAISPGSTIGKALQDGGMGGFIRAWRALALWTDTRGAELGLARRRTAEMTLFLQDGLPEKTKKS